MAAPVTATARTSKRGRLLRPRDNVASAPEKVASGSLLWSETLASTPPATEYAQDPVF